jgi:hypothetical protein
MMLDLMEREARLLDLEAKLLDLDAKTWAYAEPPPDRSHVQPTIWSLLAQAGPTDLETIKQIKELDPVDRGARNRSPNPYLGPKSRANWQISI